MENGQIKKRKRWPTMTPASFRMIIPYFQLLVFKAAVYLLVRARLPSDTKDRL